jgi:uncharacterized membrane protein
MMCNKSRATNAYAAVAGKVDPSKWQVVGWFKVPDAGCAQIGTFLKDTVYILVFADNSIEWSGESGKDPALCVNRAKAFNYTTGDGGSEAHQCDAEEMPLPFRPIKVTTTGSTWTTNLTVTE